MTTNTEVSAPAQLAQLIADELPVFGFNDYDLSLPLEYFVESIADHTWTEVDQFTKSIVGEFPKAKISFNKDEDCIELTINHPRMGPAATLYFSSPDADVLIMPSDDLAEIVDLFIDRIKEWINE